MDRLFSVKDKVIMITGSSRGIGATLAKGLAERGANVIINGTRPENVISFVAELRSMGFKAEGASFDVTHREQVFAGVAMIEETTGPIEVLINNAGIQRRAPLAEMSAGDWQAVIDTNLSSALYVSQAVGRGMIERNCGKIINITSLMAEGARPSTGNYAAAKGGLKMLTKSLAAEWGRYNIQVNAIGPGYFLTDLTHNLALDPAFDGWVKQKVPLGRWGNPEELVGAAVFLSSAASDYVNGQTIYVDGGWLAGL